MTAFDPPRPALVSLIATALAEDLGVLGDVTSLACIDERQTSSAVFVAREAGVLAGTAAATEVYRQVDASVEMQWRRYDGAAVDGGSVLGKLRGSTRSLLIGERVALNLLSHCSGVASLTRRCVDAAPDGVQIRDTRKTLPGLRALQRGAVRAGGGFNHRDSLSDAVLIKDNHLAALDLTQAVERSRARWPGKFIEVECDTLDLVKQAREAGVDVVMLDNMSPEQVREAVALLEGACRVEISGRVTLETLPAFAGTGADYISIGALTHSARALDIGLDFD